MNKIINLSIFILLCFLQISVVFSLKCADDPTMTYCGYLKTHGYCKHINLIKIAKLRCKKTCNFCTVVLTKTDGSWSNWTNFGPCTGSCGDVVKTRSRFCTNPPPANGGKKCVGPGDQVEKCSLLGPCPIDGGWAQWTLWGGCFGVSCGSGHMSVKYSTRACTNPKPQYKGKPCADASWTKRQMICQAPPCPIDGGYSEWDAHGGCSATCGKGLQLFTRNCTKPKPMFNGKPCESASSKVVSCTAKPCPDSYWLTWGTWSSCQPDCGPGVLTRVRECKRTTSMKDCKGSGKSTMECRTVCAALKDLSVKILKVFPSTLNSTLNNFVGNKFEMSTLWTAIGTSLLPIITYIVLSVWVYFEDIITCLERLKETAATSLNKTKETIIRKKDDSEGRAFLYIDNNSGDKPPTSLPVNTSLTLVQPKGGDKT